MKTGEKLGALDVKKDVPKVDLNLWAHEERKNIKARKDKERREHALLTHSFDYWGHGLSQEEYDERYKEEIIRARYNGGYFLERLSKQAALSPKPVLALHYMHERLIEEFEPVSEIERMIIDDACVNYFHKMRIDELVNNAEAYLEYEMFCRDVPAFTSDGSGPETDRKRRTKAEQIAESLEKRLLPVAERYHRMFSKDIALLSAFRKKPNSIRAGNIEHVNLAQNQVNVQGSVSPPKRDKARPGSGTTASRSKKMRPRSGRRQS